MTFDPPNGKAEGEPRGGVRQGSRATYLLSQLAEFHTFSRLSLSIQNSLPFASNGNSISESHPEYEGHAHHYVITITSSRGPNGGSSALPRPSSYTAAPRMTAPCPSNLCPSYLTTLITIHSSYGCLVKKRIDVTNLKGPPATSNARLTTSEGAWAFFPQIMPPCRQYIFKLVQYFFRYSGD